MSVRKHRTSAEFESKFARTYVLSWEDPLGVLEEKIRFADYWGTIVEWSWNLIGTIPFEMKEVCWNSGIQWGPALLSTPCIFQSYSNGHHSIRRNMTWAIVYTWAGVGFTAIVRRSRSSLYEYTNHEYILLVTEKNPLKRSKRKENNNRHKPWTG